MATTITGANLILSSFVDSQQINGRALRLGNLSGANLSASPTVALGRRSGILPGVGKPLDVVALSNTSVTVKAGTAAFQATNAVADGMHSVTLTTDTAIDTITGDGTNPRIDVVVIEVVLGSAPVIRRVVGTPNASPVRPSIVPGSPTTTAWFPLAQLRVNQSTAPGIVITKLAGTDGVYTTSTGGALRGALRQWSSQRNNTVPLSASTEGSIVAVAVPAAECLPGVYHVTASGNVRNTNAAIATTYFKMITPAFTRESLQSVAGSSYWNYSGDLWIVYDDQPATSQAFALNVVHDSPSNFELGYLSAPSWIHVTRVADFL